MSAAPNPNVMPQFAVYCVPTLALADTLNALTERGEKVGSIFQEKPDDGHGLPYRYTIVSVKTVTLDDVKLRNDSFPRIVPATGPVARTDGR